MGSETGLVPKPKRLKDKELPSPTFRCKEAKSVTRTKLGQNCQSHLSIRQTSFRHMNSLSLISTEEALP
jgi:hypothetical protein